jgi:hypothetical protein
MFITLLKNHINNLTLLNNFCQLKMLLSFWSYFGIAYDVSGIQPNQLHRLQESIQSAIFPTGKSIVWRSQSCPDSLNVADG